MLYTRAVDPKCITGNQNHLFKLSEPIQENQHEPFNFGLNNSLFEITAEFVQPSRLIGNTFEG